MAKIVKAILYLIAFIVVNIHASSLSTQILNSSKQMSRANEDEIVKICQTIKSLYIKAIISNDKEAEIKALDSLIKCSKILKKPYKHYMQELSLLINNNKQKRKTQNKKGYYKKKQKNSYIRKSSLYLKRFRVIKNKIILVFNKNIKKEYINFFELNSKRAKRYRDVFDIQGKLLFKIKNFKLYGVKKVRISQYNKNTIRVVLESTSPINSTISVEKNSIIINIDNKKQKYNNKAYNNNDAMKIYYNNPSINIYDKVIIIDPGHGGKDVGAIGYKRYKEKDVVLRIALKLGKYLKNLGYKVYYTRSRDNFVKLRDRTHFANLKKADIFISIHANAAPNRSKYLTNKGVETYFLSPARSARAKRVSAKENSVDISSMDYYSKQVFLNFLNREKIISSNKLAIDIQRGILKNVGKRYNIIDGGVRKAPFWVLVGAQMPAVLVEVGYITNPTEAKRLFNPYYEYLLAKGIANGIVSYFEKNR